MDRDLMPLILRELQVQNDAYGRMNDKCMRIIDYALLEVEEDGVTPSRTVKRMATALVTSMMKLKLDTLKCLIQYVRVMAEKKRRGESGDGEDALDLARLMAGWSREYGSFDGEVVEGDSGVVADCEVPSEQEAGDIP